MDNLVNARELLTYSARICCVGIAIQSAEILRHRRELQDYGLLGWTVAGDNSGHRLRLLFRQLHRYPAVVTILFGRLLVALAVLFLPGGSLATTGALTFLLLAQLYYNRRCTMIGSGADTMQLMCLGAVFAGSLPGTTSNLPIAAITFLAVQVLLAYVASGWDKAVSPRWRSGVHLSLIFKYSLDRFPPLGGWFGRHPRSARAAAWSVILLELLFPLCLLLPAPGFWVFLGCGATFHAAVAFTMGLHGFWWSFTATYPALYFVHTHIASALYA